MQAAATVPQRVAELLGGCNIHEAVAHAHMAAVAALGMPSLTDSINTIFGGGRTARTIYMQLLPNSRNSRPLQSTVTVDTHSVFGVLSCYLEHMGMTDDRSILPQLCAQSGTPHNCALLCRPANEGSGACAATRCMSQPVTESQAIYQQCYRSASHLQT